MATLCVLANGITTTIKASISVDVDAALSSLGRG